MRIACFASCAVLWAACAPTSSPGPDKPSSSNDPAPLATPSLVAVGPSEVAVGDALRIVGQGFVDPDHGSLLVHFTGTYTPATGAPSNFDSDVPLTFVNPGVAQLDFGPVILFAPASDQIGSFRGSARIINRAIDSQGTTTDERSSDPMDVVLRVKPSVIVEQLHSTDGNCQAVTNATVGGTSLVLGLKALGLGTATDADPIHFRIHVAAPSIDVAFVRNQAYASWPLQPTVFAVPPPGDVGFDVAITSGDRVYLDPKGREQVVTLTSPISLGQDQVTEAKLARLGTGPLAGGPSQVVSFAVEAQGKGGVVAQRAATLRVFSAEEVAPYDGNYRLVERFPPTPVSACFPGGMIGADLTYKEDHSESRTRSLTMNWDVQTALSLGFTGEASIGFSSTDLKFGGSTTASWSQTFGVDVEQSTSSEDSTGKDLTVHIIPSYFGVCFRQTEQIERDVKLVYHNACGASAQVGTATLTDWNWAFDIGTGKDCPPPTNLPPAKVF
jgi:hypothetical protein